MMSMQKRIEEVIRRRIADDTYEVGSKLPSIPAFQREFDVPGPTTVRNAYLPLVSEGLLRPEQGVGVWVVNNSSAAPDHEQLLDELRAAQRTIERAIAALTGDR